LYRCGWSKLRTSSHTCDAIIDGISLQSGGGAIDLTPAIHATSREHIDRGRKHPTRHEESDEGLQIREK
jgi:hypothetical protein